MTFGLDAAEVTQRLFRYILLGSAVALASFYIPSVSKGKAIRLEDVVMISLTSASVYAILDILAPSIGRSARTGTGLGIGLGLSGFPQ